MRATLLPLFLLAAAPAQAFEITGGSIGLQHQTLTSSENNFVDQSGISGDIEFTLGGPLAFQIDAGRTSYAQYDIDTNHFTLHALYALGSATTIGAFYGRERGLDENFDVRGVEIDHNIGQWGLEAYLSNHSHPYLGGSIFGGSVDYALNDIAQLGLRYDRSQMNYNSLERIAVTAEYRLPQGFAITGELGSLHYETEKDPFVALGLAYRFGKQGKATFNNRNLSSIYPIFWQTMEN